MKIAIIGTVPNTRALAPFKHPQWECWCMGPAYADEGNPMSWNRWWELHPVHEIEYPSTELQKKQNGGYLDWLMHQDRPIYMRGPLDPRIKSAIEVPWDAMCKRYDTYFLDSTVAWMFAYLHFAEEFQGLEEVGLYGVDFAAQDERHTQKKGTYHFLALLRERGVKITIPQLSDMAHQPAAYPASTEIAIKAGERLVQQEATLKGQKENLERLRTMLVDQQVEMGRSEGAIDVLNWLKSVY